MSNNELIIKTIKQFRNEHQLVEDDPYDDLLAVSLNYDENKYIDDYCELANLNKENLDTETKEHVLINFYQLIFARLQISADSFVLGKNSLEQAREIQKTIDIKLEHLRRCKQLLAMMANPTTYPSTPAKA